jgi:hypothetical protein
MVSVRRLAVLLLPALAACAQLLSRTPAPSGPPIRGALHLSQGIPLVAVHSPRDHTAWFAVDTGAGEFTFIDPAFSKLEGLKCAPVRDPAIPFIYLSAPVDYLEIEGFGRKELTVYVTEVSERTGFQGLDVKVMGSLGTGFFRGQCIHFDWAAGTFTANEERRRLARHVPIPLRYGDRGELYGTVRVNGIPCEALFDTASPQSLLTEEFAQSAHVAADPGAPAVHLETSLGMVAAHDTRLAALALGTEEMKDVPIVVVDRRMPHANLLIGTDVLTRYGLLIDLTDEPYLVLDTGEGGLGAKAAAPAPPSAPPNGTGK